VIRQRSPHAGPFDGWFAAFVAALLTFSASLLVGTVVVLRALNSRSATAVATESADTAVIDAAEAGPAATAETATTPGPVAAPSVDIRLPEATPEAINESARPVELVGDPEVAAAISGALGDQQPHFGVVVKRLSDGKGAALNDDLVFYAASTFKLAILYEAEKRISEGGLSLDDTLQLTNGDIAEDLGTLGELPLSEDGTLTIEEALRAMVTLSDNSTAVALLHRFGGASIDTTLASLGLQHTDFNTEELPTTAGDMALLMEALYTGRGLTASARDHARGLLLGQETRSGIPAGLPASVLVGNKTGTGDGATHDVAFVEAPDGPYVIPVLSDGSWAWQPIADVSAAIYSTLDP
jgi:beta-lactamase class A